MNDHKPLLNNVSGIQSKIRLSFDESTDGNEVPFDQVLFKGQELIQNSDNFFQLIEEFYQCCCHCKLIQYQSFTNIHLPEYLIQMFSLELSPDILLFILRFLVNWSYTDDSNLNVCANPEFIDKLMNIVYPEPPSAQIQFVALKLMDSIVALHPEIAAVLLQNNILQHCLGLYQQDPTPEIRSCLLCFMFSLLISHPPFELVQCLYPIFIDAFSDLTVPYLQLLINLASAFVECNDYCTFAFAEYCGVRPLLDKFDTLSQENQIATLSLVMRLLESNDYGVINNIVEAFNWNLVNLISAQNNNDLTLSFLRLLCAGFARSPLFIFNASMDENIFNYLFYLVENEAYEAKRYATIALIHAFRFGFQYVHQFFFEKGFLTILSEMLDTGSSVLIKEVYEAVYVLHHFANEASLEQIQSMIEDTELLSLFPLEDHHIDELNDIADKVSAVLEELSEMNFWS